MFGDMVVPRALDMYLHFPIVEHHQSIGNLYNEYYDFVLELGHHRQ